MKWSKYNYLYRSEKTNQWILFNSMSGALIALDRENYEELRHLKDNPEAVQQCANSRELIDAHIFVNDDLTAIDKKKLKVLQNRFSKDIIDLTIAPTLACNFNCSYCFQQDTPKYVMSEETESNLVTFLKRLSRGGKYLRITWFGGEPLLALDRMKSFCQRIRQEVNLPFEHQVITNGYLLNSDTIHTLANLGVVYYQITIDGLEDTHNRRRPLHNKGGTFQTIMKNIETLIQSNSKIAIVIRANIDGENADEYQTLDKYLHHRFRGGNIRVYPGFTDNYSFSCSSVGSCVLSRHQRANFFVEQYAKHGIDTGKFYPKVNYYSCMARRPATFAVDPRGALYKCLSLLGVDQMSIGNVNNKGDEIENEDLMTEFLKGNDYLDNAKCNQCLLFPVCDGGCPYLKMKEKLFGEMHDTCHVAKGNLRKFLEMHIKIKERGNLEGVLEST
jgi:uncharacterized protein